MAEAGKEDQAPSKEAAPKPSAPPKSGGAPAPKRPKRGRRDVPNGKAFIQCSFNNTIVTITDPRGHTVCWSSAGRKGFKGARKSTPFAAQVAAEDAARQAADQGLRTLQVFVHGPGAGRETALRGLQAAGLKITYLRDITPIPHNGCRPSKRRRV